MGPWRPRLSARPVNAWFTSKTVRPRFVPCAPRLFWNPRVRSKTRTRNRLRKRPARHLLRRREIRRADHRCTLHLQRRDRSRRAWSSSEPRRPTPLGQSSPSDHDRRLMRHDHELTPPRRSNGVVDRGHHAELDLDKGLTPRRTPGIPQGPPMLRGPKERNDRLTDPFEGRVTFDQPLVGSYLDIVSRCDRLGRLLRALQGRRPDRSDVSIRQTIGGSFGLSSPSLGQVVAGQSSVYDALWILDFPVSDEVDGRGHARKANL